MDTQLAGVAKPKQTPIRFAQITLQDAIASLNLDEPDQIPLMIRLVENPDSPIALPGNIDLRAHDCLHILLNRGVSLADGTSAVPALPRCRVSESISI
ncbi:MAG: hypothetical protein AAF152_20915 [Cyanobacteria bacterium P01_A01_bin.114]